ncbi:MAG: hypothetical protein AAF993_06335 [Pseudomonadota bacterium]
MKKIYSMIAVLTLFVTSTAQAAEVLSVSAWQPNPGKMAASYAAAAEAKELHEALGAEVRIIQTFAGTMNYSMSFDSWQAWAEFAAKAATDPKIQKFQADSQKRQSATFLGTNMIEIVSPADEVGSVFEATSWKPMPGKNMALMQSAMKAKAIHEKEGVNVSIGWAKNGNLVYITSYADWGAYAKYNDAEMSEAFQAYWQEASQDPSGTLVGNSMGMER